MPRGVPASGSLRIYFLDVGQGDAVLVVGPDGKSLLYDAGRERDDAARLALERGVTRLDLAIASHVDADHIGGFEEVARQLRPRLFLNNGIAGSTQTYGRVIAAMRKAGTQGLVATRRTIKLGDSLELQVLPAPAGLPRSDQNANSVGVLLRFGAFRAFFGGDSDPATTAGWTRLYGKAFAGVPVYKASHHGSRHNDTLAFLRLLQPKEVIIGVGEGNRFGHPAREALVRYRAVGARLHRTDLNGTVTITAQPDGSYSVEAERVVSDAELLKPGG
jgi:competence protein ComEC